MSKGKRILLDMYRKMVTIRRFEEAVYGLYTRAEMPGLAHLYIGQEAVAVGACAAVREEDYITSTHRGHGHLIAKGGDVRYMMAEILGKETGYNRGRGGTMHIADPEIGSLGAFAVVGSGLGTATGAALSAKMRGTNQVAICFFGDGASNQGSFHETLNLAALWKLPVVYVCENNLYAISVCVSKAHLCTDIADRADAYCMPGMVVDGQDVLAVYETVQEAVNRARKGEGPTLVECKTYRYFGHHVGDSGTSYRCEEEVEEWKKRDPIELFRRNLEADGVMSSREAEKIGAEVKRSIEAAIEYAIKSPFPLPEEVYKGLYVEERG